MKIDVGYVAELARLELTDEEKSVFQPQLENIVKYVEKISEVDVEVVELLHRDLADTLFDGLGKPRELPFLASRSDDGTRADCWADRLSRLAKTYLANDKDDKLENNVAASLLATLYSLGNISRNQSFELAVAAVEELMMARQHRVCLMAYRVSPHTDPDYLMKHPFERYLRVESKATAEDGAIVPCLAINSQGFEYRRISHEYSYRLAAHMSEAE